MIWYKSICVIPLIVCLAGCGGKMDPLKSETEKFLKGYTSTNIHTVEESLLVYVEDIQKLQREGNKKYEYHYLYAIAYSRLAELYIHAGDSNAAERSFRAATNHMRLSAISRNQEPGPGTNSLEVIHKIVAYVDGNLNVGWKTSNITQKK